ncbi:dnaJ-like protein 60 [Pollicipes pollicipes]|uniref:dnaJ-like protein 60 n=1 Tax=Pollicipes pollicipes TaxID=41117 RepID=UPI0018857FD3|nr:dnaJ-like protein 60 [Pollicipes pollicipes]XP_037072356.1 dnaJ-like protein 60 [Pollicipes pollicipes]XP_037072427.1 dnaJ-like protein 60 [Pollicipes pollicipes]XP_037072428.1 dnaJ-like protein 60 [Pollicipes pollicipes]
MDCIGRIGHCSSLLKGRLCLLQTIRHESKNHYQVLGLPNTCSTKEIREAYMVLSKKVHPDVSPGSHSEFVRLNDAYQTLSRRQSRALYDASLLRPPTVAPPDGRVWRRHGDVDTTATHDRIFWDESIFGMRYRAGDEKFENKPYYGIRGLKRQSNGPIAFICVLFMALGIILHVLAIRSSHQMATMHVDEKNRRLFAVYTDAKQKAIDPKDKDKIGDFLKSLKADPVN